MAKKGLIIGIDATIRIKIILDNNWSSGASRQSCSAKAIRNTISRPSEILMINTKDRNRRNNRALWTHDPYLKNNIHSIPPKIKAPMTILVIKRWMRASGEFKFPAIGILKADTIKNIVSPFKEIAALDTLVIRRYILLLFTMEEIAQYSTLLSSPTRVTVHGV